MNKEIKDKWLKALRSGEYKQGMPVGNKRLRITENVIDRISVSVKTGLYGWVPTCWEWTATKNCYGYGVIGIDYTTVQVQRVVYFLLHPDKNIKGLCVCHTCDNRLCLRPDHLFLGTIFDNNRDRAKKGRNSNQFGVKNHRAKLTEGEVTEIRRLYAKGDVSQHDLGKRFGVTQTNVGLVVRRERWPHVA